MKTTREIVIEEMKLTHNYLDSYFKKGKKYQYRTVCKSN
jgi:hypothetical protein